MTAIVVRFLALLTITAAALSVGALALLWLTRAGRRDKGLDDLRETAGHYALPLAWLVALTATLGSLFYSEVANFIPCKLCWYQRIAMYPLVVILGIAAVKRDHSVRRYALPMVAIGGAVSISSISTGFRRGRTPLGRTSLHLTGWTGRDGPSRPQWTTRRTRWPLPTG